MKNSFQTKAALRKLGSVPEGFEFFRWSAIGDAGDALLQGGVPRIITRGAKKGRKTWDKSDVKAVVITTAELQAERALYVAETGNCPNCCGEKEVVWRWSEAAGKEFKPCPSCSGTGKSDS